MTFSTVNEAGEVVTIPKFVEGKQRIWDASSLEPLLKCRRLYKLQRLDSYASPRSSWKMRWGVAIHKVVETLLHEKFLEHGKDQAIDKALDIIAAEYHDLAESDINACNFDTLVRAAVWYAEYYYTAESLTTTCLSRPRDGGTSTSAAGLSGSSSTTVDATAAPGAPALEIRFEVPLTDTDRFSGRIDRIALFDNELAIVDTKSTEQQLSDSFFRNYVPSVQTFGYMWALKRQLGLPIKHYVIDGIQTGVSFTRFERARLPDITDQHLDEWYAMVVDAVTRADDYLPNFSACYGCSFRNYCAQGTAHLRSIVLEHDFIKRTSTR